MGNNNCMVGKEHKAPFNFIYSTDLRMLAPEDDRVITIDLGFAAIVETDVEAVADAYLDSSLEVPLTLTAGIFMSGSKYPIVLVSNCRLLELVDKSPIGGGESYWRDESRRRR